MNFLNIINKGVNKVKNIKHHSISQKIVKNYKVTVSAIVLGGAALLA